MDSGYWRILQLARFGLMLFWVTILVVALIVVLGWPRVRGRGLLLLALGTWICAALGNIALGSLYLIGDMVPGLRSDQLPHELIQCGYLLVQVVNLTGIGILLAALVTLAPTLRAAVQGAWSGEASWRQ